MTFCFRSICAAATLAVGLAVPAASATAQMAMNLGWATPLESSNGVFAEAFAEKVAEYTDNAIEVRLRPSAQIATEDDAVKALQLGTVDGYLVSQNNISPHFSLMDVFVLPYVFRSSEHALNVVDGEIGEYIKEQLYERAGIHLLSFNNMDARDLYNTRRPINTFEDFGGLKYRVPLNQVMIETFRAFGAEPVPMAWSEVPTALQTGTIDGADNGTSVILDMKFYEFAEHLAVLEHFIGFTPLLVSDRFMSRLSDEQAEQVRRAALDAQAHQREVMSARLDGIRNELAANGMAITYPERGPFIEAAQGVQDHFAAEQGEEFQNLLQRIRETEG